MPLGYAAVDVLAGLEACDQMPPHLLRSLSFDQGSEWAEWATLAAICGLDCWFCEPHSPWQRGQIENLDRPFRFWFPRGTDLGGVAQADADHAARSSTGNAAADSTTTAPPTCTLPSPCTDRWTWPTAHM